jgi:hypothetical protein
MARARGTAPPAAVARHDGLYEFLDAGTPPPARLTMADRCLLAVAAWEYANDTDAPQPHVVVLAWQSDRTGFGLPGYSLTYPNSNRVVVELVKVVARGLLCRPREGHYRLTPAGRKRVAELAAVPGGE